MADSVRSHSPCGAYPGAVFVIEGPDGVGKSTVARGVTQELANRGLAAEYMSFPGRQEGTLGGLVYRLHHDPDALSVKPTPLALQTLHIAAHFDLIDRVIRPALSAGRIVVLDRYWWSTWVYGVQSGLSREMMDLLTSTERTYWGETQPLALFLIQIPSPHRPGEDLAAHAALSSLYSELFARESDNKSIITNDGEVGTTIAATAAKIELAVRQRSDPSLTERPDSSASGITLP